MKSLLLLTVSLLLLTFSITISFAQSASSGSLIIPMDDTPPVNSTNPGHQSNMLKAYGLVYHLIVGGVPVQWAYSTTKAHDGTDFSVSASQVKRRRGDTTITSAFSYKGSAFIIDVADTAVAGPIIRTANSSAFTNVTIHQVLSTVSGIPVQHTLTQHPKAFVMDKKSGNLSLITDVLADAGLPSSAYVTSTTGIPSITSLSSPNCYSIVMIPHEDALDINDVNNLKYFGSDGGNVYMQCHCVVDFDDLAGGAVLGGRVLTTAGLTKVSNTTWVYPDSGAQIHFGQFVGTVETEGGSVQSWVPNAAAGSAYKTGAIPVVRASSNLNQIKHHCIRMNNDAANGWFFYAGSHDYDGHERLSRLLLNAFLVPAQRVTCAPLPVELTGFTASMRNGIVYLRWTTATEVDNFGFEIERSYDNRYWAKIGFINGNGTVNTPQEYSYEDRYAKLDGAPTVFYRLKQVDRDGSYAYSHEVEVILGEAVTTPRILSVYPNPFNPSTMIRFALPVAGSVNLVIRDMLGREVLTLLQDHNKEAGIHSVSLEAANLPSGIYTALLRVGASVSTMKLVLER